MEINQSQKAAREFFLRVLANGRLAHAYAITGPDGADKMGFAVGLAQTLLCPAAPDVGCRTCSACQRAAKQVHPDLHILAPAEGKREIGIDAVRGDLIHTISLKPFEAQRKVFIVAKAEWMTEEAADCLLKTLEEPPPNSVLLLLTPSPDLLQPTIRSRCQVIRLAAPAAEEVAKELARRFSLPPDKALTLARLTDGDLERAAELHESGWEPERDAMLRALASGDRETLGVVREGIENAVGAAGRLLEAQRTAIRQRLMLLLLCCRDLLVAEFTQDGDLLFNRDVANQIHQGAGRGAGRWEYLLERLLDADDAVLSNVNLGLLLDYLFQRLAF